MNPEIQFIIDTLKSGRYSKIKEDMANNNGGFCAIGACINEKIPDFFEPLKSHSGSIRQVRGKYCGAKHTIRPWEILGISSELATRIVKLNDESDLSFDEIAQIIEQDFSSEELK